MSLSGWESSVLNIRGGSERITMTFGIIRFFLLVSYILVLESRLLRANARFPLSGGMGSSLLRGFTNPAVPGVFESLLSLVRHDCTR
jgi:hypothetical protein